MDLVLPWEEPCPLVLTFPLVLTYPLVQICPWELPFGKVLDSNLNAANSFVPFSYLNF